MREMLKRTNSFLLLQKRPRCSQKCSIFLNLTYLGVALTKSCVREPDVKTCWSLGGLGGRRRFLEDELSADLTETVALYSRGGGGRLGGVVPLVKEPKSL